MKALPPGSRLGILGGGQLGRMIAVEARRMGYRTVCWDPVAGGPAEQVCDEAVVAEFQDENAAARFLSKVDVITFEWENVPFELAERLNAEKPLHPAPSVLATIQDRLVQRQFLAEHKLPQTEFSKADTLDDVKAFGYPCVLKTRRHGYDGKGQAVLMSEADLPKAAALLQSAKMPCVVERFVSFKKEISVILARGHDGQSAVFPIAENVHRNGILHTTLAPAHIPLSLGQKAALLALDVADRLQHVGVLAVEMFVSEGAAERPLLINEIAPRVHNSGHYTLGACRTSQFEQHARAVLGLTLGDPQPHSPALMVNLLGDLWKNGEPRFERLLKRPDLKLHLYGKAEAKPGRKMGHLVVLGEAALSHDVGETLLRQLSN